MAAQKKTKNKSTKRSAKKAVGKKAMPAKKKKLNPAKKRTRKKVAAKRPALAKSPAASKNSIKKPVQRSGPPQRVSERRTSHSGDEAGDLQGISRREVSDSESVDELLEEGNAFEAEAVSGVEAAENADEGEVRTHEVPTDDVPGEYLDEE
jgi:hypothetical protein